MSKRKPTPISDDGTVAWAGRIEKPIYRAMKEYAKATRRSIGSQINVALEEWLTITRNLSEQPPQVGVNSSVPRPAAIRIPPSLAKYVGPQDLSGMGSVLPGKVPAVPLTEDDTLPEVDGTPLGKE